MVLLLANFIPLWGVMFRGWDIANILHLYWAENVAVGLITFVKILTNRHSSASLAGILPLSLFFAVHYGFFCFGHAQFVFGGLGLEGDGDALDYLWENGWLFVSFFVSHLVSFFLNYHGRGEARELAPQKVMFQPYRRIVILHVTIILGGMAVAALGSPVGLIVALVVIKTVADVFLHRREHSRWVSS